MRILLTGRTGQVGWELRRTLAPLGEVSAPGRDELDLRDLDRVRTVFREVYPDVVVNSAAYTDVDGAESEPDVARSVNATAPGVLAEEAARTGATMVHFSTDYVFDGAKGVPYTEEDDPAPLNVYGQTKLEGEEAVRAAGGPHLILRTAWVFGLRRPGFLCTMIDLFRNREEVRVVEDQVGSPTWCRMVAEGTAQILHGLSLEKERPVADSFTGTYHLAAAGETTRYAFARAIRANLEAASGDQPLAVKRVLPASPDEFPRPARRPAYSALSSRSAEERFGIRLPAWELQLALCVDELRCPAVVCNPSLGS